MQDVTCDPAYQNQAADISPAVVIFRSAAGPKNNPQVLKSSVLPLAPCQPVPIYPSDGGSDVCYGTPVIRCRTVVLLCAMCVSAT